jgi:hypothetical protein
MFHYRAVTRENFMQASFSGRERFDTIRPVGRFNHMPTSSFTMRA